MKPTSIIFLILSVILIAGGVVTCVTAIKIAEADGIELLHQQDEWDEDKIEKYNFFTDNINRVVLVLKNADVNIIGGSEESYVQFVNFAENMYEFTISNNTMTFKDSLGISSMFKITSGGLEFNGLRHYLYGNQLKDKRKLVNIYISSNEDVKHFSITATDGDVLIKDMSRFADYNISLETGNVKIEDVTSISELNVIINNGGLDISTPETSGIFDIEVITGDIHAQLTKTEDRGYYFDAPGGVIKYFGENKYGNFELEPISPVSSFRASIAKGDIIVSEYTKRADDTVTDDENTTQADSGF